MSQPPHSFKSSTSSLPYLDQWYIPKSSKSVSNKFVTLEKPHPPKNNPQTRTNLISHGYSHPPPRAPHKPSKSTSRRHVLKRLAKLEQKYRQSTHVTENFQSIPSTLNQPSQRGFQVSNNPKNDYWVSSYPKSGFKANLFQEQSTLLTDAENKILEQYSQLFNHGTKFPPPNPPTLNIKDNPIVKDDDIPPHLPHSPKSHISTTPQSVKHPNSKKNVEKSVQMPFYSQSSLQKMNTPRKDTGNVLELISPGVSQKPSTLDDAPRNVDSEDDSGSETDSDQIIEKETINIIDSTHSKKSRLLNRDHLLSKSQVSTFSSSIKPPTITNLSAHQENYWNSSSDFDSPPKSKIHPKKSTVVHSPPQDLIISPLIHSNDSSHSVAFSPQVSPSPENPFPKNHSNLSSITIFSPISPLPPTIRPSLSRDSISQPKSRPLSETPEMYSTQSSLSSLYKSHSERYQERIPSHITLSARKTVRDRSMRRTLQKSQAQRAKSTSPFYSSDQLYSQLVKSVGIYNQLLEANHQVDLLQKTFPKPTKTSQNLEIHQQGPPPGPPPPLSIAQQQIIQNQLHQENQSLTLEQDSTVHHNPHSKSILVATSTVVPHVNPPVVPVPSTVPSVPHLTPEPLTVQSVPHVTPPISPSSQSNILPNSTFKMSTIQQRNLPHQSDALLNLNNSQIFSPIVQPPNLAQKSFNNSPIDKLMQKESNILEYFDETVDSSSGYVTPEDSFRSSSSDSSSIQSKIKPSTPLSNLSFLKTPQEGKSTPIEFTESIHSIDSIHSFVQPPSPGLVQHIKISPKSVIHTENVSMSTNYSHSTENFDNSIPSSDENFVNQSEIADSDPVKSSFSSDLSNSIYSEIKLNPESSHRSSYESSSSNISLPKSLSRQDSISSKKSEPNDFNLNQETPIQRTETVGRRGKSRNEIRPSVEKKFQESSSERPATPYSFGLSPNMIPQFEEKDLDSFCKKFCSLNFSNLLKAELIRISKAMESGFHPLYANNNCLNDDALSLSLSSFRSCFMEIVLSELSSFKSTHSIVWCHLASHLAFVRFAQFCRFSSISKHKIQVSESMNPLESSFWRRQFIAESAQQSFTIPYPKDSSENLSIITKFLQTFQSESEQSNLYETMVCWHNGQPIRSTPLLPTRSYSDLLVKPVKVDPHPLYGTARGIEVQVAQETQAQLSQFEFILSDMAPSYQKTIEKSVDRILTFLVDDTVRLLNGIDQLKTGFED